MKFQGFRPAQRAFGHPVTAYCDVNDDYSIMAMVESGLGVSLLSELVTCRMPFDIRLKVSLIRRSTATLR